MLLLLIPLVLGAIPSTYTQFADAHASTKLGIPRLIIVRLNLGWLQLQCHLDQFHPLKEGDAKNLISEAVFFREEKVIETTSNIVHEHSLKKIPNWRMIPKDALEKNMIHHSSTSGNYSCGVALNGTKRSDWHDQEPSLVFAVSAPYSLVIEEKPGIYSPLRNPIPYGITLQLKCMYSEPHTEVKWEKINQILMGLCGSVEVNRVLKVLYGLISRG